MSDLPSRPAEASRRDLFKADPEAARARLDSHDAIRRRDSALTVGEREMIAVDVSGLNACADLHGIDAATAARFGIAESVVEARIADIDTAPVDDRLKPLLRCLGKLTRPPGRLFAADAEAVFAAGWPEEALFHAVSTAALFNLLNRLVDGLGIAATPEYTVGSAERLSSLGDALDARSLEDGGAGS